MSDAKRFNKDKIDLTYHPKNALYEWAKCWMFGAEKYSRDNWKKLWGDKTIQVAMASLLRHATALNENEHIDPDSLTSHAANIMCNCAMIIEWQTREGIINPEKILKKKQKNEEHNNELNITSPDDSNNLRMWARGGIDSGK